LSGTFTKCTLILESPVVHVYGDSGWSEMTWTFPATVKVGGPKITTTGRETQIYHKDNGVWRIVHIHYSGPPVTRELKGF
jgi:ketosteroid isomerase-like protein